MELRETFNGIIDELNAPRFFEARWGCIRWGKVNQNGFTQKKVAKIRDYAIKHYERLNKNGIDVPAFQYADRDVDFIVRSNQVEKTYQQIAKIGA